MKLPFRFCVVLVLLMVAVFTQVIHITRDFNRIVVPDKEIQVINFEMINKKVSKVIVKSVEKLKL